MKIETVGSSAIRKLLGLGSATIRARVHDTGSFCGVKPCQTGIGKELRFPADEVTAAYLRGDFDEVKVVKPAGDRISADEMAWIAATRQRRITKREKARVAAAAKAAAKAKAVGK
jgi:hypothetical protein